MKYRLPTSYLLLATSYLLPALNPVVTIKLSLQISIPVSALRKASSIQYTNYVIA